MKKITLEGQVIGVSKYVEEDCETHPTVKISIPASNRRPDSCDECSALLNPEVHTVEVEMDEENARYFASHIFSRVRITFDLIHAPKIVNDEEEKDPEGPLRGPGNTGGVQDNNEAS